MADAYEMALARRREEILARIEAAAERAGRSSEDIRLVAVSKTVGEEELFAAIRAGYRSFAENRPQMLNAKLAALAEHPELPPVDFDLIGNLQKNKINAVIGRVGLIHSISSSHLAQAVSSRVLKRQGEGTPPLSGPQDVLIEVNVSGEATKSGFSPEGLRADLDGLRALPGIRIRGLMTMAPRGDRAAARRTFEGLGALRDELADRAPELDLSELSCGMSEDFEEAVAAGSTIVRLGRVVFDPSFALR
ncbi:MAG: YggS family pyridoxal phosphate-dependent enzyme [Coriobacteriaceae bacterium]|nr:YggS family pyridoxal phosphate-dependent enzyme [Coriobacteriaceae bacterium]